MLEGRGTIGTETADRATNGVGINWNGPGGHYLEWVMIVSTRCALIGRQGRGMGVFIGEGWAKEEGDMEGKGRREQEGKGGKEGHFDKVEQLETKKTTHTQKRTKKREFRRTVEGERLQGQD